MRRLFCALPSALAFALAMPAHVGTAEPLRPTTIAQAEAPDDEEQAPPNKAPDSRQEPSEEPIPGPQDPPRMGDSRRPDLFDAAQDARPPAPHPAALAHPDHDIVVCEAGCDKTAGSIVYMKKRE